MLCSGCLTAHDCTLAWSLLQGITLHSLWQLEQDLLKRLEVESLDCVQLPAGCSSLLSMLAKHDELAAALSGHEDSLDIGPVLYDDVMSVVRQAVEHLQHSMRASRSLTPHGRRIVPIQKSGVAQIAWFGTSVEAFCKAQGCNGNLSSVASMSMACLP